MARTYFLTTDAITALTDPDAILATPLNLLSEAHRYDDAGNLTGDDVDIGLKNIHTIAIKPGNSANDSLLGTSGDDIVFWDFQTLSGITISLSLLTRVGLPSDTPDHVIERFDLGDGNDVINLTHNANLGFAAYSADALIFGGDGNDVVWSGAGNDTIFGGNGTDWLDGGAGNDTIYGGAGTDSLDGGSGNDTLFGGDGVLALDAGTGADVVQLTLTDTAYVSPALVTGPNDTTDGADFIVTFGSYTSVNVSLGGGPDVFIGSSDPGTAPDGDLVFGQDGNDLIAGYNGGDTLYGGAGDDVLWGGAGSDTIFGGDGDDYLYVGPGGNNVAYGGAGLDFFEVFRNDGTGNQIYDLFREGLASDGTTNALVVGGDPAPNEIGGDFITDGTGVRETDHNIMDNVGGDDTVQVHQVSGNIYELDVIGGAGTLGMNVQFDVRDVPNIILWDNDAVTGQVQQLFVWDGSQYVFWNG